MQSTALILKPQYNPFQRYSLHRDRSKLKIPLENFCFSKVASCQAKHQKSWESDAVSGANEEWRRRIGVSGGLFWIEFYSRHHNS